MRNSRIVPLAIPVKPTLLKMLDKGTPDNDKLVGGLLLPKPLAGVAANRGKNPSVPLPMSRAPFGFPGSMSEPPAIKISPGWFPVTVVWGATITPAALVVSPPFARSTVPETLILKVSDGRKFPETVKVGPEKTLVPKTVVLGIINWAAWTGDIARVLKVRTEEAIAIFDKLCLSPPPKWLVLLMS
jgi:hypothetical protein